MKKTTTAAKATKATAATAAKKVKKDLTQVGKAKRGPKPKDEKKVDLVQAAKKRGRKSNAEKAAEQAIIDKAVDKAAKKALANATKLAEKAPKKSKAAKTSAYDWATANFKKPNDAAARKLIIGDVIEVFYNDQEKASIEVVIASCDKSENIFDVATVSQDNWQNGRVSKVTAVNSDMWRKIGTMKFKVSKD